ncbi:MAG: polyphenol oxidase family protein [Raoultibacter sp.]
MAATTLELVNPRLSEGRFASITALTDEDLFAQTGVRIAFTQRSGGVSVGAYDSLNLGSHVKDDASLVQENRRIVRAAFDAQDAWCVIPNQVHGSTVLTVSDPAEVTCVQHEADEGADGILITTAQVAALLCFADCMPVIVVSPTGHFAVVHAGWRGVEGEIAAQAVRSLAAFDEAVLGRRAAEHFNVYIGPYIHAECFETSSEVHDRFTMKFGNDCAFDFCHIDLGYAQRVSLIAAGIDPLRLVDAGECTVCANDGYFSYRAQGGICGRHGAFAICSGEV